MVPRIIIAGTHSGVGKTTITVGLIASLCRRGLLVQPFKVGPDYIDPTHHTLAAGRPCRNLDTWMIPPERVRSLFSHHSRTADIAVIEGVMGLHDGFGYEDETGSTAQVARLLQAPVILVIDASRLARSGAALALGYQGFDREVPLAGFILNQVGSEGHGAGVAQAIEKATRLPVLGWLPREDRLQVPERHLGLVPTTEAGGWQEFVAAAGETITRRLDLDSLLLLARQAPKLEAETAWAPRLETGIAYPEAPVIAVARDAAFHFTYEENLELLRASGAKLTFFSPLRDAALPPGTAGLMLSGGFPEVHAAALSANHHMRQSIQQAHARRLPIYAECGGLMYLTEAIVDHDGRKYPMVGVLPGDSVMSRRLTLGYRLAQAAGDSWLLRAGETVRGHEFHYSIWQGQPDHLPPAYFLLPPSGVGTPRAEGVCLGNLWASYVHLHFWARPELAERFMLACRAVQVGVSELSPAARCYPARETTHE